MEYNFIIVQQLVNASSDEESEGNRLSTLYNVRSYPYLAIINPLTAGVEYTFSQNACSRKEEFTEAVTNFLMTRNVDNFPAIVPSDRISSISSACIKPLNKQSSESSNKREKPSSPAPTSPAKCPSPSSVRDIATARIVYFVFLTWSWTECLPNAFTSSLHSSYHLRGQVCYSEWTCALHPIKQSWVRNYRYFSRESSSIDFDKCTCILLDSYLDIADFGRVEIKWFCINCAKWIACLFIVFFINFFSLVWLIPEFTDDIKWKS